MRQLLIQVGDGAAAQQLLEWLRDEDALRGRVELPRPVAREGELGGALGEIVTVAVSSGAAVGIVTALARSLTTWLTHRRSDITVTITRPGGRSVEFTGQRVDAATVLGELDRLIEPGE